MNRVLVLGEVLCDLFPPRAGVAAEDAPHLVPHAGGAPANCAVQIARLGVPVSLLTAVGDDPLGARALALVRADGVNVSLVARRARTRTGITLVEVDADGERRFTPWRERTADLTFTPGELPLAELVTAAVLVHGTVSLRRDPARAATNKAVTTVRRAGGVVALDVNLRGRMYPDLATLHARARRAMRRAHLVKATVGEARAVLGDTRARGAALVRAVLEQGPSLVALTDGAGAAWLGNETAVARHEPPAVRVVDATGAGDAFFGALIADLVAADQRRANLSALDAAALSSLLTRACAAGARATTRLGATTAMPRRLPGKRPFAAPSANET